MQIEDLYHSLDRRARDLATLKDRVAHIQAAEDEALVKLKALELAFSQERNNLSNGIEEILDCQLELQRARIKALEATLR